MAAGRHLDRTSYVLILVHLVSVLLCMGRIFATAFPIFDDAFHFHIAVGYSLLMLCRVKALHAAVIAFELLSWSVGVASSGTHEIRTVRFFLLTVVLTIDGVYLTSCQSRLNLSDTVSYH